MKGRYGSQKSLGVLLQDHISGDLSSWGSPCVSSEGHLQAQQGTSHFPENGFPSRNRPHFSVMWSIISSGSLCNWWQHLPCSEMLWLQTWSRHTIQSSHGGTHFSCALSFSEKDWYIWKMVMHNAIQLACLARTRPPTQTILRPSLDGMIKYLPSGPSH